MAEFKSFGKIPRLSAMQMIVTEKIDGTNACVVVDALGVVSAQSRTRAIQPGDDNYGFALWVSQNEDQLRELGHGHHFGEWWGVGIQRAYALHERRFSLFNTHLWSETRPACCHVVPILYMGPFDRTVVGQVTDALATGGSVAAPGYMNPEGTMVFVTRLDTYIKNPIDNEHKGVQ